MTAWPRTIVVPDHGNWVSITPDRGKVWVGSGGRREALVYHAGMDATQTRALIATLIDVLAEVFGESPAIPHPVGPLTVTTDTQTVALLQSIAASTARQTDLLSELIAAVADLRNCANLKISENTNPGLGLPEDGKEAEGEATPSTSRKRDPGYRVPVPRRPLVRTPARKDVLIRLRAQTDPVLTHGQIAEALSALPGKKVTRLAVDHWVYQLGLPLRSTNVPPSPFRGMLNKKPVATEPPAMSSTVSDQDVTGPTTEPGKLTDVSMRYQTDPAPVAPVIPSRDAVAAEWFDSDPVAAVPQPVAGVDQPRQDEPSQAPESPAPVSMAAMKRAIDQERIQSAPVAPRSPGDEIVADAEYIRRWAAQRGMPQGPNLNMRQINRKATSLGLRPFADPQSGRRAA